ncbi:hypothetical protein KIH31_09260 [Paenarthrobacter sp. DKR-5]|nr:hypothetical protein [Paenarthrobacter sp. DKR-5]MBT1002793.1 hypothetical protein [Paenarthrobacter sp. DKR-5]
MLIESPGRGEWRRKRYTRTRKDWLALAGLAALALCTGVVVLAAALLR